MKILWNEVYQDLKTRKGFEPAACQVQLTVQRRYKELLDEGDRSKQNRKGPQQTAVSSNR